ncbi:homocysteine-responsive endoplasmic reticulum-resident ubiquitin-like domain member 2 protein [Synchiropus picturatus]
MEGDAEDAPVTLVIRSTSQDFSDQTVHCFHNWTVGELKSHLSDVYPRKPRVEDQRLIYSGKLLEDHLVVKDVLRKQDEYYILHLICSTKNISDSPKPSCQLNARDNTGFLDSNVSPSEQSGQPSSDQRREESAQQANMLMYHQWYTHYMHSWYSQRWIPPPYCNTLMLAWWQQMYAQQHFHQTLDAQTRNSSPTQVDTSAEETLEEVNNAWPEWACTSLFGAVLLGVFFFFTSFNHFFLVVMAVLFLYLHEAGWLGNDLMIPGDNLNENLPNHDLQDVEQEEQRETSAPHMGYLSTAWSFISNFFMSLIPAGTPHAAPQDAD